MKFPCLSNLLLIYICKLQATNSAMNEGDFELFGNVSSAGQMPYRLMLPRKDQPIGRNILVSVALSASHMGYGCLRLEPQLMILGQGEFFFIFIIILCIRIFIFIVITYVFTYV